MLNKRVKIVCIYGLTNFFIFCGQNFAHAEINPNSSCISGIAQVGAKINGGAPHIGWANKEIGKGAVADLAKISSGIYFGV